jgi:hypothetical protein
LAEDLGATSVVLSPQTITHLDALVTQETVSGERYAPDTLREIDTEQTNTERNN